MRVTAPATFRDRLFRVFFTISIMAALLFSVAFSVLDILSHRREVIEDVSQGASLVREVLSIPRPGSDASYEEKLLALSGTRHHLSMVCRYDADNRVEHYWSATSADNPCPAVVRAEGVMTDARHVQVARAIMAEGVYRGIIYAQAPLMPWEDMLLHSLWLPAIFLLLAFLISHIAAYYSAMRINTLMDGIRQQIDCLTNQNTSECALISANATSETMAMFEAIRNLRIHLEGRLVPKETVEDVRRWYENVFSKLFFILRERIPEDSILITVLADCELFLSVNNPNEPVPRPELTNIAHLIDEARSTAKALSPPGSELHLAVSLKAGTVEEWMVQPVYLRVLLRHLLLIGLTRTHSGLVSLRLEVIQQSVNMVQPVISWQLEDSGPPMQEGALHSYLVDMPHKMVSVIEVSWMLAVRITKRLRGTIEAQNAAAGLLLKGTIPVMFPDTANGGEALNDKVNEAMQAHRLILMVGEHSGYIAKLCEQIRRANCRVMWVASHIQALELAPALPFSAIMLAPSMIARDGSTLRRLLALMDNKTMPAIPLWAVTTSAIMEGSEALKNLGVSDIVRAPANQEKLTQLCRATRAFDPHFLLADDAHAEQEFSGEMQARLPALRREFRDQLTLVCGLLAGASGMQLAEEIMHHVHGVKSAALALGYRRVALLMANLEHILVGRQSEHAAGNIAVIVECLRAVQA